MDSVNENLLEFFKDQVYPFFSEQHFRPALGCVKTVVPYNCKQTFTT
jgi:hypothetical protein